MLTKVINGIVLGIELARVAADLLSVANRIGREEPVPDEQLNKLERDAEKAAERVRKLIDNE